MTIREVRVRVCVRVRVRVRVRHVIQQTYSSEERFTLPLHVICA